MFDTMTTSFHIIDNVICTSAEKRTYPHKHYVYCLNVQWSDGEESVIYRKYSSFFDFQAQLRDELKTREDVTVPELPALRLFERENRVGKDTAEKRRRKIEDFCRQALSLPPEVICKPSVTFFFEQLPTDKLGNVKEPPSEGQQSHGLATKLLKFFEDNKRQKKFLTKGAYSFYKPDKQHKRSSSIGNVIESGQSRDIGSQPALSYQTFPSGSVDQFHPDTSPKTSSRRDSDSEVLDGQCKVTSDYDKRAPNEISLKEGDTVEVVDKLISGWWLVQIAGGGTIQQGWAPGSCLEPIEPVDSMIVTKTPHQGTGSLFKALIDYTAQDDEEVTYTTGQEVVVLEANMDGWWLVQVNGRKGLTPAANLEEVIDEEDEENDLYDYVRYMRTSRRESQLYKKPPAPRRSSTLRKTQPLVTIRNSDMDDYAEIDDFSVTIDLGDKNNRMETPSALKPPYAKPKAHSISDPSRPVSETDSIDTADTTDELNSLYAHIDKTKKIKKGGDPGQSGTRGHNYVNCDVSSGDQRPTIPERQYSQSELRDGNGSVKDGRDENVGKEQGTTGLTYINVEVGSKKTPHDPHQDTAVVYAKITPGLTLPNIPSEMLNPTQVKVKPLDETLDSPPTSPHSPKVDSTSLVKALKPGKNAIIDDRAHPWYLGYMSRQDAEDFLKKHAKQNEFLVRESVKKQGDFTISVLHDKRVRHFRIERTSEGQYLIGRHNFLRVQDVLKTYQKQPMFVDENDVGVLLSKPVSTSSLRLPAL
ncbi:uncharacterized protein LOC135482839 isoform X2 [Lineus longissimus]